MTVSTNLHRALVVALALLVAASLGYAFTVREGADAGAGGGHSLDERWDPTGSHPLPNEGVQRAP
jgi:hypothetical protein